jgi:4-aminobutyrate aminotransferase
MAAVIAREDLDVAPDIALGHYTHEKSPLGAVAALATLECIEEEGLLAHARELGRATLERLRAMQAEHPLIGDVRGLGLQIAVELVRPDGAPAVAEADAVMYAALRAGLSFKVTGGNVLALTPPLIITHKEMDQALDILSQCLSSIKERA